MAIYILHIYNVCTNKASCIENLQGVQIRSEISGQLCMQIQDK